jgi:hypothetical protein
MRWTERWREHGEFRGAASHGTVARLVPKANGETDLGRGGTGMARRLLTRIGVAVSVTAVVLSLSASAVLAGEITGTGKSLEPLHANSICAYSGLNDDPEGLDPENGPPGRVQSYGQVIREVGGGVLGGIPGEACRGGSL